MNAGAGRMSHFSMRLAELRAKSPPAAKKPVKLPTSDIDDMRETYERWKEVGCRKGYRWLSLIYGPCASTCRDIVKYRYRIDR